MANFLNFEIVEVTGVNKDEAMAKAPFSIMGDATPSWKAWKAKQVNGFTSADEKQFMIDYLASKSKNVPGVGFAITIDSAVADTRERPYSIVDKKNEQGKRQYVTVYQLVDNETGAILGEVEGTKQKAKELAKELITNGFHGTLTCLYTKQVRKGENVAFTASYAPSKGAHAGSWKVFGIKN